ncbi:MAG: NPCBM/NEW2 domain-containing protein [Candidatus Aminicenantes bacterium]|nr:NPCBM/NEW2 domain-containing protein [Candidatus Aminicenantes bacterium]
MLRRYRGRNRQLLLSRLFSGLLLIPLFLLTLACGNKARSPIQAEKPASRLPEQLPCRIQDGLNPDLMVMTLGNVQTPLADGTFYPYEDRVVLKNGQEIKNYFKNKLGIKYFQPIDKTNFQLPPSGWCSWYYYYQEINQEEIEKNAQWLAQNLREYGALYCQIDDGWQDRGQGPGENRDWTKVSRRFSKGMANLAKFIKDQGLIPGIWLAPHGQSNEEVVKNSGAFLLTPDGKSASSTWEGKFLIDPSKPEAQSYLKELFTRLAQDWGYEYFKIDGQPIVVEEFRKKKNFMKSPQDPEALYRQTLETIRQAIGPKRYLLGCWGIPLEGMGIMNGSRTGGDIVPAWDGFLVALDATMKYYFLHNIAWYCDPDVMLVRYPLTLDMAKAWASLQGLTGQALMASDRMYDLPEERIEILRRVFPAVDIRPLDLFPSSRYKKIWDLKINHLERQYDVVGCFNYDQEKTTGIELRWADLGLEEKARYHVYDFWNKEYLGCWEKGFYVEVPPASVRVLTLLIDNGQPQLISTSRHITQGWVDLESLFYDPAGQVIKGKSRVIKGDPYELRFVFPRDRRNLKIKRVEAPGFNFAFHNHDGWATVTIFSQASDSVSWEVYFEEGDVYNFPARAPSGLKAELKGLNKVLLEWAPLYYLNAGYNVYVDGKLYLYTPINRCQVSGLNPSQEHSFEVKGVWLDGSVSEKAASLNFKPVDHLSHEVYLSDLEPAFMSAGRGFPRMDKAFNDGRLQIGNKSYKKGIGTQANSEIVYELNGLFKRFEAEVGLDAGSNGRGSVEFKVFGDGKLLWASGVIKGKVAARKVQLNIAGVKTLRLVVEDAGDGIAYDHADWAEARILR